MLAKMAKMCVLTFVIVFAFWGTAAESTEEAITTIAANLTNTNDTFSSHVPAVIKSVIIDGLDRNERTDETLAEIQIGISNDLITSTSTSTATPTTTATTSTTTTTVTTPTIRAATTNVNGNEADNGEVAVTVETTTMAEHAGSETTTAATSTIKLISKKDPPLASLSSVFDRLYRIKFDEPTAAVEHQQENPAVDSAVDADADTEFHDVADASASVSPLQIQMQAAESYQVAETLADLNDDERRRYGALLAQQPIVSKLNIVDLYPVQLEDFQPIIRSNNDELLKQHTVFTRPDNSNEYRQNLMPNEVEMQAAEHRPIASQATTMKTVTSSPSVTSTASYFTGRLLAEQDGLITDIERKFQLRETTNTLPATTTTKPLNRAQSTQPGLPGLASGDSYIDRRVKKSFEFPIQHRASDVMAMPHVDFANTKFNTDANDDHEARTAASATAAAAASSLHPEFSTTKFYNSKELYNEMLLHNKRKLMKEIGTERATAAGTTAPTAHSIIKSSEAPALSEGFWQSSEQQPRQVIRAGETTKLDASNSTRSLQPTPLAPSGVTLTSTAQSFDDATAAKATATAATITSTWTTGKPIKYEKELKRAKLLLKALTPPGAAADHQFDKLEVVAAKVKITASASTNSPDMARPHHTANLTKSLLKPIARPRILSRLQEKINSLDCDIQNVPQDSHLWRGNETHELLLPIVTKGHCKLGDRCTPNLLTWEGEAEIQSGDILIVEINDAILSSAKSQNDIKSQSAAHAVQVYQVTRSGHEHCDVTEGVLLDITPLVVDGRKLVTLYDKDLTEGVNLLIVVSELWGAQCVRLKVTTKTDNCGENADCSGKGVCYSNVVMEEYECQCCSGFAGPHCEEIDACNPSPCTNNGICVDLSQGHEGNSYQCLCPYGYTGKNCQYESDPCNPADCMNGGSCVGNSTHFRCDCTPGYTGPLCQHGLNACESSPCVHGICVDQEDGFRCFCQPDPVLTAVTFPNFHF